MAGRDEEEEEEEKSPVGCGRKCPRRWKDSEDSVLEMDDLLPVGGGGRGGEDTVGKRGKRKKETGGGSDARAER